LIGADGLWSNIPQAGHADGPPRVSAIPPIARDPNRADAGRSALECGHAVAGPKCHIVHYPLSGWKVFNLVVTYHNNAPEPVAGQPVSDQEVMKGFAHLHERARNIIRHGKNWKLWVLCDRDPTERWIDGRRAAWRCRHPMLQYFAQGACRRWKTRCACRTCWAAIR